MECLKICHDIKNSTIMEHSPVDKIAKMMDFYYPDFFSRFLDVIEDKRIEGIKAEFHVINGEKIDDSNYQLHLSELFWTLYTKLYRYIDDIMFLNDYYLYINFFLQYPILTGNSVCRGMTFESILEDYRKTKIKGTVYRFISEVEYMFIIGKDKEEDDEDDMIAEICGIDDEIQMYGSNDISLGRTD